MSLLREGVDRAVLESVFIANIKLAKRTEAEAIEDARQEWRNVQHWIKSPSRKEQSFLWFCDEFDLEPTAVLRAIKERK